MNNQTYTITIKTPLGNQEEYFKNNKITARYHAERRADFLSVNGKTVSVNWNYIPLKANDIVWLKKSHESKQWYISHMWSSDEYVIVSGDDTMTVGIAQITRENPNPPAPTDPTPSDELESSIELDKYESELCECGFTLIPEHKLDALDYLETRYDINYTKWTLGRYWTVTSVHGAPLPRYEEPALKPFGYNDIADVMDGRLTNQFTITTDLFGGDGDELATIPEVEEMLDRDAYDGWQLFVDDTRDGELRLYAERVTDDIEDATPSRYSDWVAVDGGFCYMTIGRRA